MTKNQLDALSEIVNNYKCRILAIEKTSITEPLVIKFVDGGGNVHCIGINDNGTQVTYQV